MTRFNGWLFFLTIFFIPSQLGLHLWLPESLVLGRRIDYLSPTLFFSELFILITALIFDAPHIWMVKNKRSKQLQNVEEALKAFVEYYLICLRSPSPLLPIWSDVFLRKEALELEKIMQKSGAFKDPILSWVQSRIEMQDSHTLFNQWAPFLKKTFKELIQIYPTREKKHAEV